MSVRPITYLQVLRSPHDVIHFSIKATERLLIKICAGCQKTKGLRDAVRPKTVTFLQNFPTLDGGFDRMHFNLGGPLPLPQGCRYVPSRMHSFKRFPEATRIQYVTSETAAQAIHRQIDPIPRRIAARRMIFVNSPLRTVSQGSCGAIQ